ncbi:hypothetical protein L1987_03611 [Smallanthus sonchifolius]|uniref:Uncharacterized protein n=1 Tax=Smallanthus sonchifolius TaxID=185202 RepID=A0ACB9KB08_9ASTR|nr:hypothetical protein L1987_03611 [Smallanthus sonchifolius]
MKFHPNHGITLIDKQQCLLDNLWHIQTMPHASSFKVQILNALSIYFSEQGTKCPEKTQPSPKFTHYIIFRGTKIGIFNKWEIVAKYIQCHGPIYKGYHSFSEALYTARSHFGLDNFFIEPEEVQTFSQVMKTSHEQIIKSQEEIIANLQRQLIQQGQNTHPIQDHIEYKFEQIISQKINTEFPFVLYDLQLRLMSIALNEEKYKGIQVVERTDDDGEGTCLLLLQINLKDTDMPNDLILQFYHNGMIDFIELELNPKTEGIINLFGEKFVITTGNISTHISPRYIGCKIFSSFPFANDHTYRPARKRIFISHKTSGKDYLKNLAIRTEIQFSELYWIWSHKNWNMLLPFIGEGESLQLNHIMDQEDYYLNPDDFSDTDTIPDTHRDF